MPPAPSRFTGSPSLQSQCSHRFEMWNSLAAVSFMPVTGFGDAEPLPFGFRFVVERRVAQGTV